MLTQELQEKIFTHDFLTTQENGGQVLDAVLSGTETMVQLLGSWTILSPVVQLGSRLYVLYEMTSLRITVYATCSFSLIFICGTLLLNWSTQERKKMNRKYRGSVDLANAYANQMQSAIANCCSSEIISIISTNASVRTNKQIPIDCATNCGYKGLEVLQSVIVSLCSYIAYSSGSDHKITTIFMCLFTASNTMWWLFTSFSNIAQTLAGSSCLEDLLERLPPSNGRCSGLNNEVNGFSSKVNLMFVV